MPARPTAKDRPKDRQRKAVSPRPNVRVQFVGTMEWMCPECDRLQSKRVSHRTWRVQCMNRDCEHWFVIGWRFWQLPNGPCAAPLDSKFPAAVLARQWASGSRANEYIRAGLTEDD